MIVLDASDLSSVPETPFEECLLRFEDASVELLADLSTLLGLCPTGSVMEELLEDHRKALLDLITRQAAQRMAGLSLLRRSQQ